MNRPPSTNSKSGITARRIAVLTYDHPSVSMSRRGIFAKVEPMTSIAAGAVIWPSRLQVCPT